MYLCYQKLNFEMIIHVTEIKRLRWINKNTWKNRFRNEEICLKMRVTPNEENMRESRLRWFGHVWGRAIMVPMRKCKLTQVEETKKRRGKPKTLVEVVKKGHGNQGGNREYEFG